MLVKAQDDRFVLETPFCNPKVSRAGPYVWTKTGLYLLNCFALFPPLAMPARLFELWGILRKHPHARAQMYTLHSPNHTHTYTHRYEEKTKTLTELFC